MLQFSILLQVFIKQIPILLFYSFYFFCNLWTIQKTIFYSHYFIIFNYDLVFML